MTDANVIKATLILNHESEIAEISEHHFLENSWKGTCKTLSKDISHLIIITHLE